MGKIHVIKDIGDMAGLCLIEPVVYGDAQGDLMEAFHEEDLVKSGLNPKFVQDNQVFSYKGVLRGLHINRNHPQRKLIRAVVGSIYDDVVDLRKESNTFKQWLGIMLSEDNHKQLYVPEGFAHGYLVLSQNAKVEYKVSEHYIPGDEIGIAWNSAELSIKWPKLEGMEYNMSYNDANNKPFSESDFY